MRTILLLALFGMMLNAPFAVDNNESGTIAPPPSEPPGPEEAERPEISGGTEPVAPPPTLPPDEPVVIPVGNDYMACVDVGVCAIVFGAPGAQGFSDLCSSGAECTEDKVSGDRLTINARNQTRVVGSKKTCCGNKCVDVLAGCKYFDMLPDCATDADCGGAEIFTALVGANLETDIALEPPLSALVGNERVNFYSGEESAYAVVQNGVVMEAGEGELPDNTVNVRTDQETLEAMATCELTPMEAFAQDKIIVEGEGFGNWLKFAIMNFLFDLGMADFS